MMMVVGLMAAGGVCMAEEILDPSIFDGTGREQREEPEEKVSTPEEERGPGGGEPEEDLVEESASPGSPAEVMTESRAGDRVESTEKIAPGQAVDFPWDM